MIRTYATEFFAFVAMLVSVGAMIICAAIACDLVSFNLMERLQ